MPPCPAIVPAPWHLPIGMFIGILGFLGIVVPFVREKVGRIEKASWTILLFVLLLFELSSIHIDQIQHDREQELARCQQLQSFKQIADELSASIKQNETNFDKSLGGIQKTLTAANKAIDQTKPAAYVQFSNFRFLSPLAIWGTGKQVSIESLFSNNGTDSARDLVKLGRFYLGSVGLEGRKHAYKEFQSDWKKNKRGPSFLARGETRSAIETQDNISDSDVVQIKSHVKVLYFFFRVEYSDKNGKWGSTACRELSDFGGPDEVHCAPANGTNYNEPRFKIR